MNLKLYMRWAITAILLVAMTGCEKWLDVRPESEVGEGDMFSTEQGFMDALYGVYVSLGKNDLLRRSVTYNDGCARQTLRCACRK